VDKRLCERTNACFKMLSVAEKWDICAFDQPQKKG
jgi:hypothetical protein